jgi:Na+-driven multidrug efflux pump
MSEIDQPPGDDRAPLLLPGAAIGVAVSSIAGQNFGAQSSARVWLTFRQAALISIVIMAVTAVLLHGWAEWLAKRFTVDQSVTAVTTVFLKCMSLGFMAQGVVCVCSGMFQGLGNTKPLLITCATYFLVFAIPALWVSTWPGFQMEQLWYLAIASITLQAAVSLRLLHLELRRWRIIRDISNVQVR